MRKFFIIPFFSSEQGGLCSVSAQTISMYAMDTMDTMDTMYAMYAMHVFSMCLPLMQLLIIPGLIKYKQ